MGPIVKAVGNKGGRAAIGSWLKWRRAAGRQKRFSLVPGARVLLENTQVAVSTTGPFAPEMYEVTPTIGALRRIRSVWTGKVKSAHAQLRLAARRLGKRRRATLPRYSRAKQ